MKKMLDRLAKWFEMPQEALVKPKIAKNDDWKDSARLAFHFVYWAPSVFLGAFLVPMAKVLWDIFAAVVDLALQFFMAMIWLACTLALFVCGLAGFVRSKS